MTYAAAQSRAPDRPSPEPLRNAFRTLRTHLAGAAAFSAVVNLLYLTPTLYMMQVYDRVVPTGGLTTLVLVSLAAVAALAVLALLDALRTRLLVRAALRLDRRLAGPVLRQVIEAPQGASAPQAMRDLDNVKGALSGAGALAVFDAPWTPLYLMCAFLLHPALGALTLLGGGALVLLAILNERRTRLGLAASMKAAATAQAAQEGLFGQAETIRALGMRDTTLERQAAYREWASNRQAETQLSGGGYTGVIKLLRLILQSAALGLGAYLAVKGQLSPGAIIAASVLMSRSVGPIELLVGAWPSLVQAKDGLRRLQALFKNGRSEDAPRTALPPPAARIRLDKVSLRQVETGQMVLRDISIEIGPGETVGVIGASGSGKTSLARVLAGAVEPSGGSIRLDGAEYSARDGDERAHHIGYLPQNPSLFAGRIRDNISRFSTRFGEETDAAVVSAAQRAGAHDMILSLPGGYDAVLGPLGTGVSAGQTQRIALARALFGNPVLFVLDEPNSNLDQEGEIALTRAIKAVAADGAAVVVVAHRAGILAGVDRLVLLHGGAVQAQGERDAVLAAVRRPISPQTQPAP